MSKRVRDFKVGEETATNDLDLFLEYYEIYPDEIDEESAGLKDVCKKTIVYIREGSVVIKKDANEDIMVTQILKKPPGEAKEYTYDSTRMATAKMAMKDCKDNDNFGRMYGLMGSLSGVGINPFKKLKAGDLKVAECLAVLFLQSSMG